MPRSKNNLNYSDVTNIDNNRSLPISNATISPKKEASRKNSHIVSFPEKELWKKTATAVSSVKQTNKQNKESQKTNKQTKSNNNSC